MNNERMRWVAEFSCGDVGEKINLNGGRLMWRLLAFGAATAVFMAGCQVKDTAFEGAAKGVVRVQLLEIPGSPRLEKAVADRGGFPTTADVTTTKKATEAEFALGFDKEGGAVVALIVDKEGKAMTVTDADLLKGYVAKARILSGEREKSAPVASKASQEEGTAQESGDPGRGASAWYNPGKVPAGCPIKLGMSQAQVRKVIGGNPDAIHGAGAGHEWWVTSTLSRDLTNTAMSEAESRVTAPLGMFGGVGSVVIHRQAPRTSSYEVYFDGDRVVGVVVHKS